MVACRDRGHGIGHSFLSRAFVWQAADVMKPNHPRFSTELHPGRECRRIIKRTNGDIEMLAGRIVIKQRRSAIPTKTPYDRIGALEQRRRAARPCQSGARDADQRGKDIPHGFLAHAAMADMCAVEYGIRAIPHGPALASTGDDDGYRIHGKAFAAFGARCNI